MQSIGILGYGRFGKTLANLLAPHYHIKVYDDNAVVDKQVESVSKTILLKEKTIFIAVPINQFEKVIESIASDLSSETTVLDVCSIKLHPVKIMEKYLPKNIGIIATHPLFGPDSINSNDSINFMMYPVRDTHHCYHHWKTFFSQRFNIVEITPDEHDRLAARSQGVVHFITRFLDEVKLQNTPIDTLGFKQLIKLINNNCNDSWELFCDLQNYNPYSKEMIEQLDLAFHDIKTKLQGTSL